MFKWTAFPFIRISLCLSAGIILYDQNTRLWSEGWQYGLLLAFGILLAISLLVRNPVVKGLVFLGFMVYAGGVLALLADPTIFPNHYTAHPHVKAFVGQIVSDHTDRTNHQRYEMDLKGVKVNDTLTEVSGRIYFYVRKDSSVHQLFEYGDLLTVDKSYFSVAAPKNPHEFDYQAYLKKQGIYAHAFVQQDHIKRLSNEPPNVILAQAYKIRSQARIQLASYITWPRERAILTALLLGIKDYLGEDLKAAYASAGAMHVLAVSGLHVGIIYLMLSLLFHKWKETKYGKYVFVVFSVMVIWLYALVTGFSPSVMRAATMFSVIIISGGFRRKANIYNSLGIAAFVLILYDPYIIYAVGFQLSFAAVLGIVLLHPHLYRLLDFSRKVPDYLWSITCVSIAAQIATFPLTMLYFHQFPTYFLVSNLIVIPAAFVMLFAGISMLLVGSIIPVVGAYIGWGFQRFVWFVNELVGSLQWLPKPIFDWLYFDVTDTILVYFIMLFGILALIRYNFQYFTLASVAAILFFGWEHLNDFRHQQQRKIIFYEIEEVTAIDLISGTEAQLLIDDYSEVHEEVVSFQVDPNRLANGLPRSAVTRDLIQSSDLVRSEEAFDLIEWEGIRIAMIKNVSEYELTQPLEADVIYFRGSDDVLYSKLNSDLVLLGTGFNYYETQSVRKRFDELKIPTHSLAQDGYYELDLNELSLAQNSMEN